MSVPARAFPHPTFGIPKRKVLWHSVRLQYSLLVRQKGGRVIKRLRVRRQNHRKVVAAPVVDNSWGVCRYDSVACLMTCLVDEQFPGTQSEPGKKDWPGSLPCRLCHKSFLLEFRIWLSACPPHLLRTPHIGALRYVPHSQRTSEVKYITIMIIRRKCTKTKMECPLLLFPSSSWQAGKR